MPLLCRPLPSSCCVVVSPVALVFLRRRAARCRRRAACRSAAHRRRRAARRRAAPCRRCAARRLVACRRLRAARCRRRAASSYCPSVVVSPIAVVMPPVAVLPLAVVPPITVAECVVCRVSKKYLYRKKVILGTQLLQTDRRRRRQATTANGRQREIFIFYLDEVCALFFLVLMVQILHTNKPIGASQRRDYVVKRMVLEEIEYFFSTFTLFIMV